MRFRLSQQYNSQDSNAWLSRTTGKNVTPENALEFANEALENARKEKSNPSKALPLCNDAKSYLKLAKRAFDANNHTDPDLKDGIASAYHDHAQLLDDLGHPKDAQKSHIKAQELGYIHIVSRETTPPQTTDLSNSIGYSFIPLAAFTGAPSIIAAMTQSKPNRMSIYSIIQDLPRNSTSSEIHTPQVIESVALIRKKIFDQNIAMPIIKYALPETGERITNTPQLAYCLSLLSPSLISKDTLQESEAAWVQNKVTDLDEQERLQAMAADSVRVFVRDELKQYEVISEVLYLAPILDRVDSRSLLKVFVDDIEQSRLLDAQLLDGLAKLVRDAPFGSIDSDDSVKILKLLNVLLKDEQSTGHLYQISTTVSRVLDGMVDMQVEGLKREHLHEPLSDYLKKLQDSSDPPLVYQAAYAYQALQYISDEETILRSMLRRTGKVVQGISGMVSAVKAVDINVFIEDLQKIQSGLATAVSTIEPTHDTCQDVKSLAEADQENLKPLQEGHNFNRKSAWYPALRLLDRHIQEGRFIDFEKLIREAPCRHDAEFQWGVCQRLQELAISDIWDDNTRQSAISFLGELYKDDATWRKGSDVKRQILSAILYLTQSSDTTVSSHARVVSQELEMSGIATEQGSLANEKEFVYKYLLPPQTSQLLDYIQNMPDIEVSLRRMRRHRLKEQSVDVYVSPRAKTDIQATGDFDLRSKVQEFLDSDRKVFLLLGDSGSGKSTFSRALEADLWDDYKIGGRIPLYIHLPSVDNLAHNMIEEHLSRNNFTEEQILELKLHREFILICDGYDESQTIENLYTTNQLNQEGQWRAHMMVNCRTEYTGADYLDQFRPTDKDARSKSNLFQEMIISPFNKDQIHDYVDQFVSIVKPLWKSEEYLQALHQIPNLQDLVKNPLLLKISMDVLPRLVSPGIKFSETRLTRTNLYDEFLAHWIDRSKTRFGEIDLNSDEKDAYKLMLSVGFKERSTTYLKDLAAAIYENQRDSPIIKYSEHQDLETWKARFFNTRDENCLLQQSIPLIRNGCQYRFLHRSVLEHGLTLAIFDPNSKESHTEHSVLPIHRDSTGSTISLSTLSSGDETVTATEPSLLDTPLGRKDFVRDKSILEFLVERAQQHAIFKDQLHAVIQQSKVDKDARIAAANAITVLVKAGFPFIGEDLRGINIPGADLSNGMFDSVQLEGADLRKVNLQSIWLRQADLSRAQMEDVQFGELPYLEQDERVNVVAYSPNGEALASAGASGDVGLYETSSWDKIGVLKGHRGEVISLGYSATGRLIVSGSFDSTIRLWDVDSRKCLHTFKGHGSKVTSVAYSPKGDRVASGSEDKTVRVWDVDTRKCIHILKGHSDGVTSVMYSPSGDQIASESENKSIRLWDAETGDCIHILECSPLARHELNSNVDETGLFRYGRMAYSPRGDRIISGALLTLWDVETGGYIQTLEGHSKAISCVAYSPAGDLIASGSLDYTVRLWDAETCRCIHTLQGHTHEVTKIAFSPRGSQIASASADCSLRLYDVETGNCLQAFQGHTLPITCIAYSPDGHQIATGSVDFAVRLWDPRTTNVSQVLQGHDMTVFSTVYSRNGDQIVSASEDKTLRLWDSSTGNCIQTLRGHSGEVTRTVHSPNGDQIASGSADKTVRLWDSKVGSCTKILEGHGERVTSVAYSIDGSRVASGSNDATVKLWDVESGRCIHTFHDHHGCIAGVAFSPKGDCIASGSDDCTVRVWDVETGRCIHTIEYRDPVSSVAYSPKGNQIASGSNDNSIKLWDVEKRSCTRPLLGHQHAISNIVYSLKGDQIVSGSFDKTARLWDVKTRQCLLVISGFTGYVLGVDWKDTLDGQYLVTGSSDKSVRQWRITKEEGKYKAFLCWSSSHSGLTLSDATFDDLGGIDHKLLTQYGAVINSVPGINCIPEKESRRWRTILTRTLFSFLLLTLGFILFVRFNYLLHVDTLDESRGDVDYLISDHMSDTSFCPLVAPSHFILQSTIDT